RHPPRTRPSRTRHGAQAGRQGARNGDAIANTKIVAALNPVNQNCTDRPMDGATGNPFRRPLLYWPVRATVRSVDSTLYSFLRLSTLSTSPESVKTPHRKRKALRRRRSSRSYGGRRT